MNMRSGSSIVLVSGGLDSAVLLHYEKSRRKIVVAVSVRYGQRHAVEIDMAREMCKFLGVEHIELSMVDVFSSLHSALLSPVETLPEDHYTHENQIVTVVPNRNMILLSVAIAIAEDRKIGYVAFAAHANDRAIYPDCRPEFVEAMSIASELGTYGKVKIVAPFVGMTKAEIVKFGSQLGVDFSQTWSCYAGGPVHCGKCATCQERREAFVLAGVEDPTDYM